MKELFAWFRRYFSVLYLLLFGLFIYVVFFNNNSYSELVKYNEQIERLERTIKENEDSLEYYRNLYRLLNVSPDEMERIARERYHMQGPNEEVFVVPN